MPCVPSWTINFLKIPILFAFLISDPFIVGNAENLYTPKKKMKPPVIPEITTEHIPAYSLAPLGHRHFLLKIKVMLHMDFLCLDIFTQYSTVNVFPHQTFFNNVFVMSTKYSSMRGTVIYSTNTSMKGGQAESPDTATCTSILGATNMLTTNYLLSELIKCISSLLLRKPISCGQDL